MAAHVRRIDRISRSTVVGFEPKTSVAGTLTHTTEPSAGTKPEARAEH